MWRSIKNIWWVKYGVVCFTIIHSAHAYAIPPAAIEYVPLEGPHE